MGTLSFKARGVSIAALLLPLAQVSPAAPAAERLTLDRAVGIAMEGSRRMQIGALEVESAGEHLAATKTRRYPSLNLDLRGTTLLSPIELKFERGAFGDFPATGPIPDSDTQVTSGTGFEWFLTASIAQPILQQRRIGLGVKTAEADVEVAREKLRSARLEIRRDVRQAYCAVLQAGSSRDAAGEAVKFLEELERVVTGLVEREASLPSDLLDVRSRLQGARYKLRVAGNSTDTAKERLNLLLGRDVGTPFEAEPLPGPEAPGTPEDDLDAAVAKGLRDRPDVRQARLMAREADLDLRAKRAEYLPDLSFVMSNYSFNVDFLPRNVQTAGFALSWEPFDWGRKRHESAGKARALSEAERSAAETEAGARVEVAAMFRALGESRALIDVREAERAAAKEKARVLANRYEQKASLLKDVLQSQSDLAQAEDQWQQAVLAYWSARASFQEAIGEE